MTLKRSLGVLRIQATLAREFIKGPGQLVGGVIVSSTGSTTTARSGIGDLNLSGAYLLTRENGAMPSIEVGGGGQAVLPPRPVLGTGEADYSVNASICKVAVAPGHAVRFDRLFMAWKSGCLST